MSTLTVWKYNTPGGAEEADGIAKGAAADGLVQIVDTAWVRWDQGEKAPCQHHTHADVWKDTGWGAFWGVLLGIFCFIPLVGVAIGAAAGAVTGAMDGIGIRKEDIARIRAELVPGTSVLFLVTKNADVDRVAERFHGVHSQLLQATLDDEEAKEVTQAFEQD